MMKIIRILSFIGICIIIFLLSNSVLDILSEGKSLYFFTKEELFGSVCTGDYDTQNSAGSDFPGALLLSFVTAGFFLLGGLTSFCLRKTLRSKS